jgi:hypothetical protein
MIRTFLTAVVLLVLPTVVAANQVRNGDFKAGNVGFTSGLRYVAPTRESLSRAGAYTIGSTPRDVARIFPIITDRAYNHESGMGKYIIANGSLKKNAIAWRQDNIKVVAGQEYVFDNWFAILSKVNRPVFEAYYDLGDGQGKQFLGKWHAERDLGIWQGMEARFIPTSTNLSIAIYNLTGANAGNNFALAAVRVITAAEWSKGQPSRSAFTAMSVRAVPEPATWFLMIVGLAAVGWAMRRQQSRADTTGYAPV